jgi:hypothetical protein
MKAAGFPPLSRRSPAASLSPLCARPRARPIWAGARGDIHSSAQGPPGLETPTHGVHAHPVQRRPVRPRGVLPLVARPQAVRPHGGRARRYAGRVPYGQGPCDKGFGSYFPSGPQFPSCGDRFPSKPGIFGVFSNTFQGQML